MTTSAEMIDGSDSKVLAELAGKQILITGTTGFVGKVLLETLMRNVPEVGGVHLLIRGSRKFASGRDRFVNEIACSSVFERLKIDQGDEFEQFCEEKVHVVTGEVTSPFFGLPRAKFEALAGKLDAIINCAASVNFREELDKALDINALSLRQIMALSRTGGDLPVIQVSTCYVNGLNKGRMREEIVRPARAGIARHADGYYEVDELINVLRDKVADVKSRYQGEKLKAKLVELGIREANHYGWNDTYTFTKWIGEQLLFKGMRGTPLTIVRPSIVESTLKGPVPGWIEGVKVADAIILAYAREKVSLFPGNRRGVVDVIPADLVANSIVLSLTEALDRRSAIHRVYQCCSGSSNPIRLGEFIDHVMAEARESHADYERLFYRRPTKPFIAVDRRLFDAVTNGVQVPLSMLGRILKLVGNKRGLRVLDNFETASRLATIFGFYTSPNYIFHNDELLSLSSRMGEGDRQRFPVDARLVDWAHYVRKVHLGGLNRYALQERKLFRLKPKAKKGQKVA